MYFLSAPCYSSRFLFLLSRSVSLLCSPLSSHFLAVSFSLLFSPNFLPHLSFLLILRPLCLCVFLPLRLSISFFSLPFHTLYWMFPHLRSSWMIRRFDNTSNFVAIIQFTCLWYKNGKEMRVMVEIQWTVFYIHTIICYTSHKYQYIFTFHTNNPNPNAMNQQKRQ